MGKVRIVLEVDASNTTTEELLKNLPKVVVLNADDIEALLGLLRLVRPNLRHPLNDEIPPDYVARDELAKVLAQNTPLSSANNMIVGIWAVLCSRPWFRANLKFGCRYCGVEQACHCGQNPVLPERRVTPGQRYKHWIIRRAELIALTQEQVLDLMPTPLMAQGLWTFLEKLKKGGQTQ